ncbi:hypothetical protein HYALB_00006060 [Hymenoscyphus albidus]|uniref:Pentatricopeptide repeat protein n=1 Tax=Hymenoscyphus albidus TaxID=595503 RepID=A0A9N9LZN3_9HELO|nr:hypothetical protein HYALB_00006060 [Hymenoscyphus albidus]
MPPPRPLLPTRTPGYICRSCLLRLDAPRRQRPPPPWLLRNVTNGSGNPPPESVIRRSAEDKPTIHVRYFEETPDGDRREVSGDPEEALLDSMRPELDDLDKRNQEILGRDGVADEDMEDAIQSKIDQEEDTRDITIANNDLESLISRVRAISDKEVITREDRWKIREILFNIQPNEHIQRKKDFGLDPEDVPPHPSNFIFPDTAPTITSTPEPKTSMLARIKKVLTRDATTTPTLEFSQQNIQKFPESFWGHLKSLKASLRSASENPATAKVDIKIFKRQVRKVWRNYLMCRSALVHFPHLVPRSVWEVLLDILSSINGTDYLDRMMHIKYIGDDCRRARVHMTFDQRMIYIEALIVQGIPEDRDVALMVWETSKAAALRNQSARIYYELGVKVFCHRAELDRALQTAETLLESWDDDVTAYRVLLPIIQTHLAIGSDPAIQTAWGLYLRLKFHMGSRIDITDYDAVGLAFLEANQADLALASFRDMMLTPKEARRGPRACDASTGLVKLSHFNPRSLATLPPEFNNKYFFGSWMKRLIGQGEIGAAKRVLDITFERGIRPDSRHVNGIIGAWMREGTRPSQRMAEDMAWRMINTRLTYIRNRNGKRASLTNELEGALRTIQTHSKPDTKGLAQMPAATIETFSILVNRYRRQDRTEDLESLFETLRKAEVQPNTYFMNELLQMDSNIKRGDWAWNTYINLTRHSGVKPDYRTFTTLWHHSCKVSRGVVKRGEAKVTTYPLPSIIFREMFKHREVLLRKPEEPFPRELYDYIIYSFSLKEDQAGTAVAFMALKKYFNASVAEETARTVILQLTRLGQKNEGGYKTRRLGLRKAATRRRMANVSKLFMEFKQKRDKLLLARGISYEDLSYEGKMEEARIVLSDLLRYAFETGIESEGREILTAPEVSKRVAGNMGVPDCAVWSTSEES